MHAGRDTAGRAKFTGMKAVRCGARWWTAAPRHRTATVAPRETQKRLRRALTRSPDSLPPQRDHLGQQLTEWHWCSVAAPRIPATEPSCPSSWARMDKPPTDANATEKIVDTSRSARHFA